MEIILFKFKIKIKYLYILMNNKYKCELSLLPNLEGIKKDGKFKFYLSYKDKLINGYECLLENKIKFLENTNISTNDSKKNQKLTSFYSLDFDYIKRYFIIGYKLSKKKYKIIYFDGLYLFKKKELNNLANYVYVKKFLYDPDSNDILRKMTYVYYLLRIKNNDISDEIIFINIFYAFYVQSLRDELINKYGKDIALDFENFNKLYIFLREKKYVDNFYKNEVKKIKDEYKIILKELKKDKLKINNVKKMLDERSEDFKFDIDYKKLPFEENKIEEIKQEMNILMKKNKK